MFPWKEIAPMIVQQMLNILFSPFFLVVIGLISLQFTRLNRLKEKMFNIKGEPIWQQVIQATGLGFAGGLAGSFIMVVMGVSLNNIGIGYLWLLALALMFINPRYLCFSYAGGIISLSYLLFGFPQVEVPQLMGLVAVLHLVESLLIFSSGHLGALPVYAASGHGPVVGAFNLQRFWPIPIIVMLVQPIPPGLEITDLISMPDWWPLIRSRYLGPDNDVVYTLLPVVAALGYGDLALTASPEDKSRWSASRLLLYSFILLALAALASRQDWAMWLAALFGPLGHEYLILKGQQKEMEGKPLYLPPPKGAMILDVLVGSPAAGMGLKSGDIIWSINHYPINSKWDLAQVLALEDPYLTVDYVRNGIMQRAQGPRPADRSFGVVLVPEPGDAPLVDFRAPSPLKRWWEKRRSGR
ncbi:MAG: PDZ domain-containing protein [Clostridia bacterium]|jgi:membrane-associated protease RseP (regulator of RpoE activity)|nr:PDZ domain-containing protein [Clostridia bacterium]